MSELRELVIGNDTSPFIPVSDMYVSANSNLSYPVHGSLLFASALGIPDPLLMRPHMDVVFMQTIYHSRSQDTMYYTAVLIYRWQYSDFMLLATGYRYSQIYAALSALHDHLARNFYPLVQEQARLGGAAVFPGTGVFADGFFYRFQPNPIIAQENPEIVQENPTDAEVAEE